MTYTKLHYQVALTLLKGVGPIKARAILTHYPDLTEFFDLSTRELGSAVNLSRALIENMERDKALEKSCELVDEIGKRSIQPLFLHEADYPRRLQHIPDAPIILYKKGPLNMNYKRVVSVVGTRSNTNYGSEICTELIKSFAEKDILVLSGMALGIDAIAHRTCLDDKVPTVAVLGHGLDRVYPSIHRDLADQIVREGALITEFPTGTNPDRENFPKRNRIVAGAADATIVIESKHRGGSLITAYLASEYDRDVFAFPGSVLTKSSQGCNDLIKNNQAFLIQSPDDFLKIMDWDSSPKKKNVQRNAFPELSIIQQKLTSIIADRPKIHVDILSAEVNLPITTINKELFELEMSGLIQGLPGKTYKMA